LDTEGSNEQASSLDLLRVALFMVSVALVWAARRGGPDSVLTPRLLLSCRNGAVLPQALTAVSATQAPATQASISWQFDSQLFLRQQQQHLLQPFQGFAAHYAKGKGKDDEECQSNPIVLDTQAAKDSTGNTIRLECCTL
jgi:hypothetical protein